MLCTQITWLKNPVLLVTSIIALWDQHEMLVAGLLVTSMGRRSAGGSATAQFCLRTA